MFKHKNIMKQKGFTLLELLVVITLLAILAVGGLVAYDGVTDNAEASAAAYNAGTLDRAVRQYRAVTNAYPDQWDNLATPNTGLAVGSTASGSTSDENDQFLPLRTRQIFGSLNLNGTPGTFQSAFLDIVEDVWGMEEIQHVEVPFDGTVAPGKFHNEGTGLAVETEYGDLGAGAIGTSLAPGQYAHISVLATSNSAAECVVGGQTLQPFEPTGLNVLQRAQNQNAMNDALGLTRCHFVVALGFGGDAASSTSRAAVQIPAAPTYTSNDVNPAVNYGRYIGLFHVARTASGDTAITEADFFPRPKLIGFVDTVGNPVDVNIAATREPT